MPDDVLTPPPSPAPGFARNPGRRIAVEPHPGRVTVRAKGRVVAESAAALRLSEDGYPPVLYIPFSDIDFSGLSRTATSTRCPWKGQASYWQLGLPGDGGEDVMWAYETPYDEMAAIAGHGAFVAGKVEIDGE